MTSAPSLGISAFPTVGLTRASCLPLTRGTLSTDLHFLPFPTEEEVDEGFLVIEGRVAWMSGSLRRRVVTHFSVVGSDCLAWSSGCSINAAACVGFTTKITEKLILVIAIKVCEFK